MYMGAGAQSEASNDTWVKKLRRCKRPLYIAVDMHLSKNSDEGGTYLHFVSPEVDINTVPKTLASQIKIQ